MDQNRSGKLNAFILCSPLDFEFENDIIFSILRVNRFFFLNHIANTKCCPLPIHSQ